MQCLPFRFQGHALCVCAQLIVLPVVPYNHCHINYKMRAICLLHKLEGRCVCVCVSTSGSSIQGLAAHPGNGGPLLLFKIISLQDDFRGWRWTGTCWAIPSASGTEALQTLPRNIYWQPSGGSEIRETLSLYFKPLQALENRNISGIHIKMVEDCWLLYLSLKEHLLMCHCVTSWNKKFKI